MSSVPTATPRATSSPSSTITTPSSASATQDPTDPTKFDDQVTLGLACLYCSSRHSVPLLRYRAGPARRRPKNDPAVREALWGGPGFDQTSFYYQHIAKIAAVRNASPALRYGRFYFRPVSGDQQQFSISPFPAGVLAFSRILMDQEIVVVANTSTTATQNSLSVITDITLTNPGDVLRILYSNKPTPQPPSAIQRATNVQVQEPDGSTSGGPLNCIQVTLAPMEVQILGR